MISSTAETPDENCKEISGGLDCGTIKHIDGCYHVQSHNIMLVEWEAALEELHIGGDWEQWEQMHG